MRIGRNALTISAALLLGACPGPTKPMDQADLPQGGSDMRGGDPGDGGNGDDGGAQSAVFSGTSVSVHITDRGDVKVPDDLEQEPIVALLPGATASYPAQGKPDGTFTIPGLPGGPVWIRHGADRFVYTTGRTIDLGQYHLGRPDREDVKDPTPVSMGFSGLSAWGEEDDLQMTIANLGFLDSPLFYAADLPALGATSVMGANFDWLDVVSPWSVSPDKGDQVIFGQLSTQTAMGVTYVALSRSASVPMFLLRSGISATVNAALTATAPQVTFPISWKRSRFESLRSAVHASALTFAQNATVSANPGGPNRADLAESPDLLRLQPTIGASDLELGALSFRNPYPTGWTAYGRFNQLYRIAYTIPGAPRSGTLVATISVSDTVAQLGAGAIAPVISPVTSVKVNGMAAGANLSGVGTAPQISWDAPTTGTPTGFIVFLYKLEPIPEQQFPRSTRVATLYTTSSSCVMPAGLMTAGALYTLQIRALRQPGVDLSRTPYAVPVQRSFADVVTAIIAP